MPRFKDTAVCIRHLDFSESSQVVVLLTRGHGKVRGLAKGSRRLAPSSMQRFSGGIELMTVGQVVATTKRTSDLATVTEWDLRDDCHHLRKDLQAQRFALYAADLTHALLADLDPHAGAFDALCDLLQALEDRARPQAALLAFQWALLADAGYQPVLDRDVHRESEALNPSNTVTFDALAGGFTADTGDAAWRVRPSTLTALRRVSTDRDGDTKPGDLSEQDAQRANRLLCSYARAILDRQLPTMDAVLA